MRTVILPSMLDILARNFALKNKGVKLYELGRVYLPVDGQDLPEEPRHLIFGTYGEHETFFTMKNFQCRLKNVKMKFFLLSDMILTSLLQSSFRKFCLRNSA